jgi:hypothetical protein
MRLSSANGRVRRTRQSPGSRKKAQEAQKLSFLAPFALFRGYSFLGELSF